MTGKGVARGVSWVGLSTAKPNLLTGTAVSAFARTANLCYDRCMTKLLRDALKQVEQLPDDEQDAAAGALLDYLAHRRDLRLTDEQLAEIRRRRADPSRNLVSHEEARARIGRFGA